MASNAIVTCEICQNVLDEPIMLPCKKYICKKHVDDLLKNDKMTCIVCEPKHEIHRSELKEKMDMKEWIQINNELMKTKNELKVNNDIKQKLIEKSGLDNDPIYKKALKLLNEYENLFDDYRIKSGIKRKQSKLSVDDLIEKVKLRTGKLQVQIEEISKKLLKKLEEVKEAEIDLNKEEEQLIQLKQYINNFDFERFESINDSSAKAIKKFKNVIENMEIIYFKESNKRLTETFFCDIKIEKIIDNFSSKILTLILLCNGDLVSGSTDCTVKIWNLNDGTLKNTLRGHTHCVLSLAVLPNGDLASGDGDGIIIIWNVGEGKEKGRLSCDIKSVWSLAVMENGFLVSGYEDGTIIIWNVEEMTTNKIFTGVKSPSSEAHSGTIYSLLKLDHGEFVSGSFDDSIKIWNLDEQKAKKEYTGHSGTVYSLVLLANGTLASGSEDKKIKIWNLNDGKRLLGALSCSNKVRSLASLSNGDLASGHEDGTIQIWDVENRNERKTLTGGHSECVNSLLALPNGNLVSGSDDKTIIVWNVEDGKEIRKINC